MKFLLMSGLFVLLVSSLSHSVSAQQDDPCAGVISEFELRQCVAREYQKADAEMSKAYRQLMAQSDKSEKPQLRAAQLAWLKFREAECDYESAENIGGTIYGTVRNGCLASLTTVRTRDLKDLLKRKMEQ